MTDLAVAYGEIAGPTYGVEGEFEDRQSTTEDEEGNDDTEAA